MKKADLADYIRGVTIARRCGGEDYQPFCFRIKISSIDLDVETLISKGKIAEEDQLAFRQEYDYFGDDLFWAACRNVLRRLFFEDADHCVLSGKPVKGAVFCTAGRTSGWLCITDLAGWEFTNWDRDKILDSLPYNDLRQLSKLVAYADFYTNNRISLVTQEAIQLCKGVMV